MPNPPLLIRLTAPDCTVTLAPSVGGAIVAFDWRGDSVLRPTPATAIGEGNVRLMGCFPLVPYSNRIRNARLAFGGRSYLLLRNFGDHPHAIHGVGWRRPWDVVEATNDHAILAFEHDAQGANAQAWPWPFRARQAFTLASDGSGALLTVTLTLENRGEQPFPCGLGWHPYFPRDATTMLEFTADSVWLNDATLLPVSKQPAVGAWSFAAARDPGAVLIDNVFNGWRGSSILRSEARQRQTTMASDPPCDRLVLYAPPDQPFMAVEPVTQETDAFNRAEQGAADTGTRVLAPGAGFSGVMRVSVTRLG